MRAHEINKTSEAGEVCKTHYFWYLNLVIGKLDVQKFCTVEDSNNVENPQ